MWSIDSVQTVDIVGGELILRFPKMEHLRVVLYSLTSCLVCGILPHLTKRGKLNRTTIRLSIKPTIPFSLENVGDSQITMHNGMFRLIHCVEANFT